MGSGKSKSMLLSALGSLSLAVWIFLVGHVLDAQAERITAVEARVARCVVR